MPTGDEGAPRDVLEDLLADWFLGALLAPRPLPPVGSEAAYAAQLEFLAGTHARALALSRAQCLRLFARLERRCAARRSPPATPGRSGPRPVPRATAARPKAPGAARPGVTFELSI